MKKFHQFIENKKLESEISIAANLMVELDINPAEFILEYVKNDKEMEIALLEYLAIQEGILDGIKAFGSNALKAAKQFGQNVWSGGGIQGGITQASDTLSGPVAKYDSAVRVLGDLVKSLESREETAMMRTKGDTATIPERIREIIGMLNRQKDMIPQMVSKTAPATQPEMKQRGAAPAAQGTTAANVSQPTAAAFQRTRVRGKPGNAPGTGVFTTS